MPSNFGGLEKKYCRYQTSRFAVLPVPFDATSTWIKGADLGPKAAIEASGNMELYDIATDSEPYLKGIFTDKPIRAKNTKDMVAKVQRQITKYLSDGKIPIVLGGEHSVSAGAIYAAAEQCPDLSILHFDAHSDRRDIYEGDKFNHACVMARAQEKCRNIISVGIRSQAIEEKENLAKDTIFFAHEIYREPTLPEKVCQALKNENIYLTIDLDVFDSGLMPSTGTPEPGGLTWYQVLEVIDKVAKQKNIIGFDVVELCPTKINKAPDFLAAKLVYSIMARIK